MVLAVLSQLSRILSRRRLGDAGVRVLTTVLIIAGAVGLLLGILPGASLLALLGGVVTKIVYRFTARKGYA